MLSRNSLRAVIAAMAILCSAVVSTNALGAFANGDLSRYSQSGWGDNPSGTNAAWLLLNNYDAVYASTFGQFEVGIPGAVGFSIRFSNVSDLHGYLPASGPAGPLTSDAADPSSTAAGTFGGEIVALKLNIDFSDAGVTPGNLGIPFGNLQLRNFPVSSNLNDLTVRQILGHANNLLGGGSSFFYTIPELLPITGNLNLSFNGGASPFAQDHLRVIPIPGDYNGNGTVDASDYVLWRNGGPLANEVDSPGTVNAKDYNEWRLRFGNPSGSGSGATGSARENAAVPEPATLILTFLAAAGWSLRRRRAA